MKRLFLTFGLLGFLATSAPAATHYFVELYSYENWRNAAAFSHTFGAFYRVEENGQVTRADISWIPQDGYMRGLRPLRMPAFGDVPGQNLSLEETFARAHAAGRTVKKFGPYQSRPELFDLAMAQVRALESGTITYRGLDMATRPYSVNCVHAVSNIVGSFYTGLRRGPQASAGVIEHYTAHGMIVDPRVRTDWTPVLEGRASALPLIRIH